jgi:hypothetical protein
MVTHASFFTWAPFILASLLHAHGKPAVISSLKLNLRDLPVGPDSLNPGNGIRDQVPKIYGDRLLFFIQRSFSKIAIRRN